jgi:hypothetical protein
MDNKDKTEMEEAQQGMAYRPPPATQGHLNLLWFIRKIPSYGFWALLILGLGVRLGIMYTDRETVKNTDAITITGSLIHKGVLYAVLANPIQPAALQP